MHERRAAGPAARGYPGPLDAGLSGTGLVADDLYLLAHDDRTGRALLPPRPLGTGLAGALLAELMLARLIGLRSDTAVMVAYDAPPAAVQGHVLLALIAAEPGPLPVRAWLGFLGQTAVAGRGGAAGAGRVPDPGPQPGPGAGRPDGAGQPGLGVRADDSGSGPPWTRPGRSPRTRRSWPGWRSRPGWASAWTSTRPGPAAAPPTPSRTCPRTCGS